MPAARARVHVRFWVAWGVGAACWALALGLAAPHDLAVSVAAARPQSVLALGVARFGEWPGWGALLWALWVLWRSRQVDEARRYRPAALSVVLMGLVCPLLVTQTLKHLWGRVRFRNLAPGHAAYTPFFRPAGPWAGRSFPSGHAAMAWLPLPVPLWLWHLGYRRAAAAAGALQLALGVVVCWGRVVAGAHYVTDVLFSTGLCVLLAALLHRRAVLGRLSRTPSQD